MWIGREIYLGGVFNYVEVGECGNTCVMFMYGWKTEEKEGDYWFSYTNTQ